MKNILIAIIIGFIGLSTLYGQGNNSTKKKDESPVHESGTHIIRLSPINLTTERYNSEIGIGISYEYLLNKKLSLIFPLSIDWETGFNEPFDLYYLYFMPGLKYYPTGQGKIKYAIGANMVLNYFKRERNNSGWGDYMFSPPLKKEAFRFGILANNYINFQITDRMSFGFVGGIGVNYYSFGKKGKIYSGEMKSFHNFPLALTARLAFNLGYRF